MNTKQYDSVAEDYLKLIKEDPSKQYVQYPNMLSLLGDVKGKLILDIGCGEGYFTREVAKKGAKITAYDISPKQIELAKEQESNEKLGITYICSEPYSFTSKIKFDNVFSNLVLMYAKDKEVLNAFFVSAFKHLKDNGKFISITINPDFKRLNEEHYRRKIIRLDEHRMKTDFLGEKGQVLFSIEYSRFSKKDYENAAKKAGFKKILWKKLFIEKAGIEKFGKDYWKGYEEDCPYIAFISTK